MCDFMDYIGSIIFGIFIFRLLSIVILEGERVRSLGGGSDCLETL